MPKDKKQKTSHGNNGQPNWDEFPADSVRENPKTYLQIPNRLRQQKQFAGAALLGIASGRMMNSVAPPTNRYNPTKKDIVLDISKKCEHVLQDNPTLLRQLLDSREAVTIIDLLLGHGSPEPLISKVSWDLDLACFAVRRVPLCYLLLPESLLNNADAIDKRQLASLFHQKLISGDAATIHVLLKESPPLIDKVVWDRELALQAVRKTPKLYLYLPASLTENDSELASSFHRLLVAGDKAMIDLLLSDGEPPLIQKVVWNKSLALEAVRKTPKLYLHLPESVKKDDKDLALTAVMSPRTPDIKSILESVRSSCSILFADAEAMQKIFEDKRGIKNFINLIVTSCCKEMVWNQDLVDKAVTRWPPTYHFLHASFRDDNIDAQLVMSTLLRLGNSSTLATTVDEVVSTFPGFFRDRDAVYQLLLSADSNFLVRRVVKRASAMIPWDKELSLKAARRCHDGEYFQKHNLAQVEIDRIFKQPRRRRRGCKYHLPLGMLASYVVADAATVWPPVLNKCRCALERDDNALKEALDFVIPMLRNMEYIASSKTTKWLAIMVRRIQKDYFEDRAAFQTLLMCISVSASEDKHNNSTSGPGLQSLKGDDETSVALKRHIAEYLGGAAITNSTKRARMKKDALMLVYSLLTLPSEFPNEGIDPADYHAPFRPEDTFYCEDLCKELVNLKAKYVDGKVDDDDEEEEELGDADDFPEDDDDDDGNSDDDD